MAHIHTEPGQHDHTASVFLFRLEDKEPKVMLHLHRKLGLYMQFGGHIELNETPWQAVTHELREESGYELDQLKVLQPLGRLSSLTDAVVHPHPVSHTTHAIPGSPNAHYHTDSCYALITTEPPRHQPAHGESTDIQLFTREQIVMMPNEKILENVREIILYIFDECLEHWKPVSTADFK